MNILHYTTVDSTNSLAMSIAPAIRADEITVIWADEQTSGRGQYDRNFHSSPGGLYFSLIVHPNLEVDKFSQITLAAGVACLNVLSRKIDNDVYIKWPNDLYVNEKKVGGILCESGPYGYDSRSFPFAVIGIGINVHGASIDYPDSLRQMLTTLQEVSGRTFVLEKLLHSLVNEIIRALSMLSLEPHLIMAEWRKHDYLYGKSIRWLNGSSIEQGVGTGLCDDGRYSLRNDAGQTHLILSGSLLVQE